MKRRTTIAGTALGPRLTVLCCGVLAVLASLVLSACTSGTSTPTVTLTPTITGGTPTVTATATSGNAATDGVTPATPTGTLTVTQTATAVPTSTATVTQIPTAAPVTGGGGTAGLHDGMLFVLGGAAVLAGAAAIAYRRKLTRED